MSGIHRLRTFVSEFTRLADVAGGTRVAGGTEAHYFSAGRALLQELLRIDDWLPRAFSQPDPARYQQYLLHCDPLERFSVVSFVWDRGQSTPIHNHTVWGMVGVLRGSEIGARYAHSVAGGPLAFAGEEHFEAGQIDLVSPTVGDVHAVRNARADGPSVSIHIYGANIGAVPRAAFGQQGERREFISGYSNELIPNIWSRPS